MLRLIREQEPPKPSTRLSTTTRGEELPEVSQVRGTDAARLAKLVRGELDWIVMKCLEKDRTRRYATADALAADVQHYLQDEPVAASPPSRRYRLRKFARRNRAVLTVAGGLAAALLIGSGVATWGMINARMGRSEAVTARALAEAHASAAKHSASKAEAVSRFLQDMFPGGPKPVRSDVTVRQLLDQAAATLDAEDNFAADETGAAIRDLLGRSYTGLRLYEAAEQHLRIALDVRRRLLGEEHPDVAQSLTSLGRWHTFQGDWDSAERVQRQALAIRRKAFGDEHALVAESLTELGFTLAQTNRPEAGVLTSEAEAIRRKLSGDDSEAVASVLHVKALALWGQKRLDEAERASRESIELLRKHLGDGPRVASGLNNLGSILRAQKDPSAEAAYQESLAILRKVYGTHHASMIPTFNNLSLYYEERGDKAKAQAVTLDRVRVELALAKDELALRPQDPKVLMARGYLYGRAGEFTRAAADLAAALPSDANDHGHWMNCALVHLYVNDRAGYVKYSRGMLERFKNEPAIIIERAAKICLFTPDLTKEELALCTELIDRAVADGTPRGLFGWYQLTKGMLEYRKGNYQAALDWIQRAYDWAKGSLPGKPHSTGLLFSAMANHQLGRHDKAEADLTEATRVLSEEFPNEGKADLNPWGEIIPLLIHLREAKALILGTPDPIFGAGTAAQTQTP
jgi:tetratricopeptide (TPR) repeat protein